MNKFQFSNVKNLWGFDLKNNKKIIMGWSIAIFSIMFLYMILFPSIQDIAKIKMDTMPKELLQFVGMEDFNDMGNFTSYFGMIFNIILVAISIFAAVFGAGVITKEEKSKSIEFLGSLNISRTEIYVSKFLTMFTGILIVVCCVAVSTLLCGFINGGETFNVVDVITIIKISSFTAFFFGAVAFSIASISSKIGTGAFGSMIVLMCYMAGYLGNLLSDKAQWLKYFSPFECFNPKNALSLSSSTILQLLIYFTIFIFFIIVGEIRYKARDYNI